ncbi:MAG: hypothetical protein WDO56_35995 [Gammaproteobacteria bacterium]
MLVHIAYLLVPDLALSFFFLLARVSGAPILPAGPAGPPACGRNLLDCVVAETRRELRGSTKNHWIGRMSSRACSQDGAVTSAVWPLSYINARFELRLRHSLLGGAAVPESCLLEIAGRHAGGVVQMHANRACCRPARFAGADFQ